MKVCFIAGTLGLGGAERQLVYMLRALQDAGVETRILCLTRGEAFESQIRDLGIEVEWVGASKNRIIRMITIIEKIRRMRVNILQSSHFYTNIYAGAAGRLLGIPCLGAVRNDLTSEIAANGIFGKWLFQLPSHLVANSKLAISRAADLGIRAERLHFVNNVVEVEKQISRGHKAVDDRVHIVFVGRLVPQKNPELFVCLALCLVRDLPDRCMTFEVAGDGPLRSKLEQQVAGSGFQKNQFIFSGSASNIDDVYRRADMIILTSNHEGTPNVILEAMAHGIPVVATKVGGVAEILDRECGVLVPAGSLEDLSLATSQLICDPTMRRQFGENGRQCVAKNHSPSNLGKELARIYALVAGGDRNDA